MYNEKYPNQKFEMSYLDSVLLPQSDDEFTVWLGAQGSDFTFTIVGSFAKAIVAAFSTVLLAFAASMF